MSGALHIEGLAKTFAQKQGWGKRTLHRVFEDLTIDIRPGEFVSVIGPSGCGKSTLLGIVAGLDRASAGSVTVDGAPVTAPGLDRAVVFQDFALFPWLTVRENVAFGLKSLRLPQAEVDARCKHFVELVGLSAFADYYPSRLSGGMRQRVGLARALAVDPAVLLMDEPFGALDALTRETMQRALGDIWRASKKTVLFITHDIGEAVYLSDRVLVLNGKPSRITAEIAIDLPAPRNRRDTRFQAQVDVLEHAVRDGAAPTPTMQANPEVPHEVDAL